MEGLNTLFRENPYEKKAKVAGAMMGQSGFAKPFLAYVLGKDTAAAQQWDNEKEQQIMDYMKNKVTTEEGKIKAERMAKLFTDIHNISNMNMTKEAKQDLLVGRLNKEGEDAEGLISADKFVSGIFLDKKNLQIQFADKKDGSKIPIIIDTQNGFIGTYNPDSPEKPVPLTREQLDSLGKSPEAPKTRTFQRGGIEVTEEFQPDGTWKEIGRGPKWNPRGESAGQPNTMIIEHPDTKQRIAIDKKNIGELQRYLNQGYVPYSTEDMNLLREYLNLTIKPKV